MLSNKTYTNEYLKQKNFMLKMIIIKNQNIHITSIMVVNENANGYFFDISNSMNDARNPELDLKIGCLLIIGI